jgi:hypothetical protein
MSRGNKNKGAAKSGAPEVSAPESPASFVLVTNHRGGAIHVGVLSFPPGSSVHDAAAFAAIPKGAQDALTDMVNEGWLRFEGAASDALPPAPEPVVEPTEPSHDPRPTLEAIAASTSAAELDAWFGLPNMSAELSEAILARQSVLSPA